MRFIGAVAALISRLWATDRSSGQLPARGEFVLRRAYVVTTTRSWQYSNGDVHVGNGLLVAVVANLNASGAQVIDERNRIACPGFIDTHLHLWGGLACGL